MDIMSREAMVKQDWDGVSWDGGKRGNGIKLKIPLTRTKKVLAWFSAPWDAGMGEKASPGPSQALSSGVDPASPLLIHALLLMAPGISSPWFNSQTWHSMGMG
jgi:hypothetical protein